MRAFSRDGLAWNLPTTGWPLCEVSSWFCRADSKRVTPLMSASQKPFGSDARRLLEMIVEGLYGLPPIVKVLSLSRTGSNRDRKSEAKSGASEEMKAVVTGTRK